jgi:hypothetical protein
LSTDSALTVKVSQEKQKELLACLPAIRFREDFGLEDPVRFYDESNLFEYIDGQAEGFIAYNFQALASATYIRGDDTVVVDVYDMEKPIQAFGVYSTFRSPLNEFVEIGRQGFKSAEGYMFWKGRYCVEVSADIADEQAMYAAAEAAAKAVDARIPGADFALELLDLLPGGGKTANSEKYVLHAVIGQGFLDNGVTAEYPYAGGVARLFVCRFGGEDAAADAFGQYLKFATAHGKSVNVPGGFWADVKYYGLTEVFREGTYVFGGVSLPSDATGLMESLKARVGSAAQN